MPAINLPDTLSPLLPYCRPVMQQNCPKIFSTYAELLIFTAAYGFRELAGREPTLPVIPLTSPSPVDLQIFRNQGLFPQVLLIALAATRSHDVAHEELRVVRLIEQYAAEGGRVLATKADMLTPSRFVFYLAEILIEADEQVVTQI